MLVRLIVPGFILSYLLAATSATASAATSVNLIPPSPELVVLDQELNGAQKAKEQGDLTSEKYRALLVRLRSDLDAFRPRVPPVPADTALHARILSRLGEGGLAAANLTLALEKEPGNSELRIALSQVRYDERDYPAALAQANAVLERDPANKAALALKHFSQGRAAPSGAATESTASAQRDKSMAAGVPSSAGAQAKRTSKERFPVAPPEPNGDPKTPAPQSPSPLVPLAEAAGLGLLAYGVYRGKGTYESEDGFDEEHRPPYGRGQRFVAGAILAGLAGATVYFAGVAALSVAPAVIRQVSSFGNQGLRLAQSQAGAINLGGGKPTNEIPETLARVIPYTPKALDGLRTLGPPNRAHTFVTAAEDISGLSAQEIQQRLAIEPAAEYIVIRFPSLRSGVSTPVLFNDPQFVGRGLTSGGAREFLIPNGPIPSNAIIEIIK